MVLISPPILRIPMLWLLQSLLLTPLIVAAYCRSEDLEVESIVAASVPYGVVALFLNKLLRTSLIVDYGDPDFARERGVSLRVLKVIEAVVLSSKRVTAVTCIDPNIGEYMRRYHVTSTFLPPGGFWKGSVSPPRAQDNDHPKRVVYAGHIAKPPAYRLDLLIEAAPSILKEVPDCEIVFVGAGEFLPGLAQRAREMKVEDRVRFLGPVAYVDAKREIADSAVAVQLLNDMCLGTKVIDYFAAGKAVVSCGRFYASYHEFLADGENCLLVGPDPMKLADAIVRLLGDDELRKKLGEKALETVRNYDYDSQADTMLGLMAKGQAKG